MGKFTHILKLKDLFEQHRGEAPVVIEFQAGGKWVASLKIESQWGLLITPKLQEALRDIPGVCDLQLN